jgi:hypothetical protein
MQGIGRDAAPFVPLEERLRVRARAHATDRVVASSVISGDAEGLLAGADVAEAARAQLDAMPVGGTPHLHPEKVRRFRRRSRSRCRRFWKVLEKFKRVRFWMEFQRDRSRRR